MQSPALDGIKVLDFGQLYNGPYCSLLLAYLGADVIKIEPPHGEPARNRSDDGEPPEVIMMNSNKKGVTLNLKSKRGTEILKELTKDIDVLVENFGVGTMDRLGVGYDVLSEINPGLIYAHGSGFGETGPYCEYPAMDLTVQAVGGVMDVTGYPDQPPVKAGAAISDYIGAVHLFSGVLAALYERERTGEGQFVEVSMHDAIYPTLTSPLAAHVNGDDVAPRTGNRHSGLAQSPYNVYETADGYMAIFCLTNRHWYSLLDVMGREDLKGDSRYESNLKRAERSDEIDNLVEEFTRQHSRDSAFDILLEAGVPCGPVREIDEVADDPHLKEREMISEVNHPTFGDIPVPGMPIRLSETDLPHIEPAPELGRDNQEIFGGLLGLSRDQIDQLKENDVI